MIVDSPDRIVFAFARNGEAEGELDNAKIAQGIDIRFETDRTDAIDHVEWLIDGQMYRDNDLDAPYNLRYNQLVAIGAELESDQGLAGSWRITAGSTHTVLARVIQADGAIRDVAATFTVPPSAAEPDISTVDAASPPSTVTTPPPGLCWAPPAGYQSYDTVVVPVTGGSIELQPGNDYRLVFPDEPVDRRVRVVGGRNVVVIGGHIRIDEFFSQANLRFGMQWTGQTGVIHIEGLRIDSAALTEGIQFNNDQQAQAQVQNLYFGELRGAMNRNHGDYIQVNNGIGVNHSWALRLCRITGRPSHYQFLIYGNDSGPIDVRYVNFVSAVGPNNSVNELQGGWINFLNGPADSIHYEPGTVWAEPNPVRFWRFALREHGAATNREQQDSVGTFVEWAEPHISGRVYKGEPPGGDYVSASSVGIGYVSPE